MADPVRLAGAPIAEALLDIQVQELAPPVVEAFRKLHGEISAEYPHLEERRRTTIKVQAANTELSFDAIPVDGFRIFSADRKRIVQIRLDGFTFNQLQPYESWQVFYAEAERLWRLYLAAAGEVSVSRVAVRYINRMIFLGPSVALEDFLTARPALMPGVPATISRYLVRMSFPLLDENLAANLSQLIEPNLPSDLAVTLDIDVYAKRPLQEAELPAVFEQIHIATKRLFFGAITDATVEKYK